MFVCFNLALFSSKCPSLLDYSNFATHSHTPALLRKRKKSWETERQNLLSTSTDSSASACLGCTERKRARQRDREGTSILEKKAKILWIGVWICMRERKLCCLPVEWRRGSGASFGLPDLQMALWTQVSTRDVKECQWDPPFTLTPQSKTEVNRWREGERQYQWLENVGRCAYEV